MVRRIDLGRLVDGTMVQPEHDVMVIVKSGRCHRYGLIGIMGEDGEGACGIKGQASDGVGVDVVLVENLLHRIANASPYVICRLFLYGMLASCSGRTLGQFT